MITMYLLILFALTFKLVLVAACAAVAYMISRMPTTPTLTYRLIMFGWIIMLFKLSFSFSQVSSIATFADTYSFWLVLSSQGLELLGMALLLAGKVRIFVTLREKFRGLDLK